jgi:hypothetical protein
VNRARHVQKMRQLPRVAFLNRWHVLLDVKASVRRYLNAEELVSCSFVASNVTLTLANRLLTMTFLCISFRHVLFIRTT